MLVVGVDTSTPAVTVGLANLAPYRVYMLAERRSVDARAHGELLAPSIAAVLAEIGATARDLTAVVAGVGPGPFTGLRVGLVTAATIGQAVGIPTYGVCSLDALGALTSGTTLVATDARRKEIYWAAYDKGVRLTDPAVDRPADVTTILAERGIAPVAAVGDGALLYAEALSVPVLDDPRYPSPAALIELAAERVRAGAPGEILTPLYLRRPDAVEPAGRKPVRQ